jgi:hypothetical protein
MNLSPPDSLSVLSIDFVLCAKDQIKFSYAMERMRRATPVGTGQVCNVVVSLNCECSTEGHCSIRSF